MIQLGAKEVVTSRGKFILAAILAGLAYLAYVSTAYYFLSPLLRMWDGVELANTVAMAVFYCCMGIFALAGTFAAKRLQSLPKWGWMIMACWAFIVMFVIMPAYVILQRVSSGNLPH